MPDFSNDTSNGLDNVSITAVTSAVPLPATFPLFASDLGALVCLVGAGRKQLSPRSQSAFDPPLGRTSRDFVCCPCQCAWRQEFGVGHKKIRPPIGGHRAVLHFQIRDRGLGGYAGLSLSSCPHLKAEELSSPLYLGTVSLMLWIVPIPPRATAATPRVLGLPAIVCRDLSRRVCHEKQNFGLAWQFGRARGKNSLRSYPSGNDH